MIRKFVLAASALFTLGASTPSEQLTPRQALVFLKLGAYDDAHTTSAIWNGTPTIFVDYRSPDSSVDPSNQDVYYDRVVYAVQRSPNGLRKIEVAVGENEGGTPDLKAIGFANADRDAAKELIIIFRWTENHYGADDIIEARILDDLKPGEVRLRPVPYLVKHFEVGCDCPGDKADYKFKTVASVRKELRRLGY